MLHEVSLYVLMLWAMQEGLFLYTVDEMEYRIPICSHREFFFTTATVMCSHPQQQGYF